MIEEKLRVIVSESPGPLYDLDPPIDVKVSVRPPSAHSEDMRQPGEEFKLIGPSPLLSKMKKSSDHEKRAAEDIVLVDRTRVPQEVSKAEASAGILTPVTISSENSEVARIAFGQDIDREIEKVSTANEDCHSVLRSMATDVSYLKSRVDAIENANKRHDKVLQDILDAIQNLHYSIEEGFDEVADGNQRIEYALGTLSTTVNHELLRLRDG